MYWPWPGRSEVLRRSHGSGTRRGRLPAWSLLWRLHHALSLKLSPDLDNVHVLSYFEAVSSCPCLPKAKWCKTLSKSTSPCNSRPITDLIGLWRPIRLLQSYGVWCRYTKHENLAAQSMFIHKWCMLSNEWRWHEWCNMCFPDDTQWP